MRRSPQVTNRARDEFEEIAVGMCGTWDQITKLIPLARLGEPKEAAHFAVSLLDGKNTYQTGNSFPISGGFNNA